MSKSKQKTLNGKNAADLISAVERIAIEIHAASEVLRGLLSSKPLFGPQTTVSLHTTESPPSQVGELPPDLLPYLRKKSETAYEVVDASVVAEDGNLRIDLYKLVKSVGWAYSPAKKLIWKPKERRQ
jgi:hypothetical protein